jgi:protein-S-isoprenylcysteine O-methyltransferase Ste14
MGPRTSASTTSAQTAATSPRTLADLVLLGITAVELVVLARFTPTFTLVDWIYLSQHLLVLGIALRRRAPVAQDRSRAAIAAVVVAYTYPYAQILYVRWVPASPAWPTAGLALVTLAAFLSLASLVTLAGSFGVRPALRDLTTTGPYRLVRHPMYLAYIVADIGCNLQSWNVGTVLLVLAGWTSLVYRIRAEERMLSRDAGWSRYVSVVRWRLLPAVW